MTLFAGTVSYLACVLPLGSNLTSQKNWFLPSLLYFFWLSVFLLYPQKLSRIKLNSLRAFQVSYSGYSFPPSLTFDPLLFLVAKSC